MKIGSSGNTLSATAALDARGLKIAIACSRFNDLIVAQLLAGARAAWARHGGADADLVEFRVPGAFELPLACQQLA